MTCSCIILYYLIPSVGILEDAPFRYEAVWADDVQVPLASVQTSSSHTWPHTVCANNEAVAVMTTQHVNRV